MKTIGIRELKSGLSRVLRDVATGDTYLVTDRGRVVAELRRPDVAPWDLSPQDRAMARLAADGRLRVAGRRADAYQTSPLRSPDGLANQLLDEDRGE